MEEQGLINLMRHSVILSEFVTYVPAVLLLTSLYPSSTLDWTSDTLLLLLQPSLLLIDHGHFQYNSVMLGFLVYALYFFAKDRIYLGAICYVLCLSFKQMGLYYAPAIFAYLLSITITDFRKLLSLSICTAAAFGLCYGPFLVAGGLDGLAQVFVRMFPFGRGLFEDKVANFWCTLNVVYKLRTQFDNESLQRIRYSFHTLKNDNDC